MVASGTRNARPISRAFRPPSACSVSATCASVDERGVAAGEEQLEALVGEGVLVHLVGGLGVLGRVERAGLLRQHPFAADPVDGPVARRGHEPGARRGRDALARPALRGDREGLLRGLLGAVEVAEEAEHGSEDDAPLLAEDPVEDQYPSRAGADLDRAAQARGRHRGGELDGRVEVVGLEREEAADRLLELGERAVGGQRAAVLDADGGRGVGVRHRRARRDARGLVQRLVVAVDGLLLLGRERGPRAGVVRRRGGAVVDQQRVLHVVPPGRSVSLFKTNGTGPTHIFPRDDVNGGGVGERDRRAAWAW